MTICIFKSKIMSYILLNDLPFFSVNIYNKPLYLHILKLVLPATISNGCSIFCVCVCVCVCVCACAQSFPTLCDRMDCSLAGPSVHGISQARIPEWVAISSSRGSSRPRDRTCVSCVSCVPYHQHHQGSPSVFYCISQYESSPLGEIPYPHSVWCLFLISP